MKEVSEVRLPVVKGGFRTGYAYARVAGQQVRLFTIGSEYADDHEHLQRVTQQFEKGEGKPYFFV